MCWNAQSIRPKLMEICDFILENEIDIAVFTETWLNSNIKLFIPNFVIHRQDRLNGEHGGVAIAVSKQIKHRLLPSFNTQIIESMAIDLITQNGTILFAAAYFPGTQINDRKLKLFKKDIRTLTSMRRSFFVCGDLNAKHRLWNNIRANAAGKILYDEMANRPYIVEHPPTPTYYPPQRRAIYPSTLDIVLTNKLHDISPIVTHNDLRSDHQSCFQFYATLLSTPHKNVSDTTWPTGKNLVKKWLQKQATIARPHLLK